MLFTAMRLFVALVFSFGKRKAIVLAYPTHANLGDQAQYHCTLAWVAETFPGYRIISIPPCRDLFGKVSYLVIGFRALCSAIMFIGLRIALRKDDLLIGHSGYFFVDHHPGWPTFARALIENPRVRMIILPQTVNFYAPVFARTASQIFANRPNLTLLCRDEVSYGNAKELFPGTDLKLFPDIVTSLIGERQFTYKRQGILFCMRNDIEAHYSVSEIHALRKRFAGVRTEITDTSISVGRDEMDRRREQLIWEKIEEFSQFELIITDRYHGTIFAAIASTPVIVINSADHKLSSGVNWFPKEHFEDMVFFARDLEEAHDLAQRILSSAHTRRDNPSYFKNKFWSKGILA